MNKVSWDEYFMTMIFLVAMKSKDKRCHNGCVVVGPHNEVRSVGYNSFPRRINDDVPERQEKPEKYFWMEHSERNAIYNATLMGVSLHDCRMFVTGVPCTDCARAIIQSGIREVIVDKEFNDWNSDKWVEHEKRTKQMFEETGVKLRYYEGKILEVEKYRVGSNV